MPSMIGSASFRSVLEILKDRGFGEEIEKTLTTATGSGALFDDVRDRVIGEEIDKRHVYWANIRKARGRGNNFLLTRKTGRPTAQMVTETGQASDSDAAYASVSFEYKVESARGSISKKAQLAGADFIDLMEQGIRDELDAWVDLAEDQSVTGDGTGNNVSGIDTLLDAFTQQQISAGTPDGGVVTLDLLDRSIDLATNFNARLKWGLTSDRVRREINALLQAQQRFVDKTEVNGGFRVLTYDDIPILDSKAVIDETVGTSGDAHRISWVDDEMGFFLAQLMPPRPFSLALTQATVQDFEVLGFWTTVLRDRTKISQAIAIIP